MGTVHFQGKKKHLLTRLLARNDTVSERQLQHTKLLPEEPQRLIYIYFFLLKGHSTQRGGPSITVPQFRNKGLYMGLVGKLGKHQVTWFLVFKFATNKLFEFEELTAASVRNWLTFELFCSVLGYRSCISLSGRITISTDNDNFSKNIFNFGKKIGKAFEILT